MMDKPLNLGAAATGYGSEFDSESDAESKRLKKDFLGFKDKKENRKRSKPAPKSEVTEEYTREENKRQRIHYLTLDAYSRHKKLINNYLQYYGGDRSKLRRDDSRDKRDIDVIKEHHRFLWEDEDDVSTWEKQLAKKYYDKLFKEYCIADLSRYKENKIAMRWRIESELVSGKGQFICGNKKCTENEALRSWEVNFAYMEEGEKKNALVKLRLCIDCSYKLNYHHKKREIKASKSKKHKEPKTDEKQKKDNAVPAADKAVNQSEEASANKDESKETEDNDNLWAGPVKVDEEKSRDEEFDDYFEDMLL